MVHFTPALCTQEAEAKIADWFTKKAAGKPVHECLELQDALSAYEHLEDTVGDIIEGKIAKSMNSRTNKIQAMVKLLRGQNEKKMKKEDVDAEGEVDRTRFEKETWISFYRTVMSLAYECHDDGSSLFHKKQIEALASTLSSLDPQKKKRSKLNQQTAVLAALDAYLTVMKNEEIRTPKSEIRLKLQPWESLQQILSSKCRFPEGVNGEMGLMASEQVKQHIIASPNPDESKTDVTSSKKSSIQHIVLKAGKRTVLTTRDNKIVVIDAVMPDQAGVIEMLISVNESNVLIISSQMPDSHEYETVSSSG